MTGQCKSPTSSVPSAKPGDFFARDRTLPELRAGDLAVLLDAGAYGMSLASHYNTRVHPAEVLIEAGQPRAHPPPRDTGQHPRPRAAVTAHRPGSNALRATILFDEGARHVLFMACFRIDTIIQDDFIAAEVHTCPATQNGRQSSTRRARWTPSVARSLLA